MSAKYGLLGLLNYGDQSGYDLNRTFTHSLNHFWHTQTSQIYKELNTMEKDGWLSSKVVYQTDKPNKKIYTITDQGRDAFFKWLDGDFIEKEMRIKNAFLIKVFFSGESSIEESIRMLKQYRDKNYEAYKRVSGIGDEVDHHVESLEERKRAIYWKMTASYGEHYFKMCVDWADEMLKILHKEQKKGE